MELKWSYVALVLFCVRIDGGVRVWVGSWPNLESEFLGSISSSVESLLQSCVDFDVAHIALNLFGDSGVQARPTLSVSLGYQSIFSNF